MTKPIATAGEAITDIASAIEAAAKIVENMTYLFESERQHLAAAIRQLHDRVAVAEVGVEVAAVELVRQMAAECDNETDPIYGRAYDIIYRLNELSAAPPDPAVEVAARETVARAICTGLRRDPDHVSPGYVVGETEEEVKAAMRPQWQAYLGVADTVLAALSRPDDLRAQGQAEGFAAAISQLRDLSAQKPRQSLWHAAELLADSLEQSRRPARALSPAVGEVEG